MGYRIRIRVLFLFIGTMLTSLLAIGTYFLIVNTYPSYAPLTNSVIEFTLIVLLCIYWLFKPFLNYGYRKFIRIAILVNIILICIIIAGSLQSILH
jgi:hypothetical protein